jgi:transposase
MAKPFTDEKVMKILKLHSQGATNTEIAEQLELGKQSVRTFFNRKGIDPNDCVRRVTQEVWDKIHELHNQGFDKQQICAEIGYASSTVYRVIAKKIPRPIIHAPVKRIEKPTKIGEIIVKVNDHSPFPVCLEKALEHYGKRVYKNHSYYKLDGKTITAVDLVKAYNQHLKDTKQPQIGAGGLRAL